MEDYWCFFNKCIYGEGIFCQYCPLQFLWRWHFSYYFPLVYQILLVRSIWMKDIIIDSLEICLQKYDMKTSNLNLGQTDKNCWKKTSIFQVLYLLIRFVQLFYPNTYFAPVCILYGFNVNNIYFGYLYPSLILPLLSNGQTKVIGS